MIVNASDSAIKKGTADIQRTAIKSGEINELSGFSEEIAAMFVETGLTETPPKDANEALSILTKTAASVLNTTIDLMEREKTILALASAWQKGVKE